MDTEGKYNREHPKEKKSTEAGLCQIAVFLTKEKL